MTRLGGLSHGRNLRPNSAHSDEGWLRRDITVKQIMVHRLKGPLDFTG